MTTATKIKFTKKVSYSAGNVTVMFEPVTGYPGFSHKVIITCNRQLVAKDWLGNEYNPSEANASYYLEKHQVDVEQ